MCSISVEPIPSTMRMPGLLVPGVRHAGRQRLARGHARVQRARHVPAEQRPVRGRRGEERRDLVLAQHVQQLPGASDRRHGRPEAQREQQRRTEPERERDRRRAGEHVGRARVQNVARERVAARQQVAVEVHAALRRAGRARGEGDDRDVVGGRVDRLEGAALGQLLDHAHVLDAPPRRPGRARRARPSPAPSSSPSRSHARAAAASSRPRCRPRAGCPASTRSPPACSARAAARAPPARSTATRRRPRRASAARRSSSRPRSPPPRARAARRRRSPAAARRGASRSGQASGGGRWSRANVSVIAAPPGR